MECSQNDVDNGKCTFGAFRSGFPSFADFSTLGKQNSERDVSMDRVISDDLRCDNEPDVLSNLVTAIGSSVSNVSLKTAMSVVTVETNLNADADPPLDRRLSFSTASEISSEEKLDFEENYAHFHALSPMKVRENENGIVDFEMVCDGEKVAVVDSLECLFRLENAALEPVYFDPRVYLAVPLPTEEVDVNPTTSPDPQPSSEDVKTASLGPSPAEFAQYLLDLEDQ